MEARLPDGRELTPFLNRKLREGLYVKRFYGNATQTVRGEVATLCGVIPAYGLSIFRGHPQLGLRCLPSVFSDLGYRTIFLEGYRGMDAFGVGPFWRGHGFQQVEACPAEVLTPAEREHVWGWGLQDDHLYRRFFRRLDDLRAQAAAPEEVRFFGTLMPISNHFFFDQLPAEQRALHPEPTGLEQHFQNSIHAVDGYLAAFFEAMEERPWLANSLVVILGDHGINLGRDQFGYAGAAEANFRVPLLVLWPGKLAPRYLEGSASQLDLLGIETAHQVQGRSLLDPARPEPTVPLVSSFQARTLAAVRHPWKLVVETEPWREFLFHLEEDPGQTTNRVAELGETGVEQELRGTIARIIQSQALVLADRVYPGDRKETAP